MTLTGAGRRLLPYASDGAFARTVLRLATMASQRAAGDRIDGDDGRYACHRCSPNFTGVSGRAADLADGADGRPGDRVLDGTLDGAFVAGPIDHANSRPQRSSRKS